MSNIAEPLEKHSFYKATLSIPSKIIDNELTETINNYKIEKEYLDFNEEINKYKRIIKSLNNVKTEFNNYKIESDREVKYLKSLIKYQDELLETNEKIINKFKISENINLIIIIILSVMYIIILQ